MIKSIQMNTKTSIHTRALEQLKKDILLERRLKGRRVGHHRTPRSESKSISTHLNIKNLISMSRSIKKKSKSKVKSYELTSNYSRNKSRERKNSGASTQNNSNLNVLKTKIRRISGMRSRHPEAVREMSPSRILDLFEASNKSMLKSRDLGVSCRFYLPGKKKLFENTILERSNVVRGPIRFEHPLRDRTTQVNNQKPAKKIRLSLKPRYEDKVLKSSTSRNFSHLKHKEIMNRTTKSLARDQSLFSNPGSLKSTEIRQPPSVRKIRPSERLRSESMQLGSPEGSSKAELQGILKKGSIWGSEKSKKHIKSKRVNFLCSMDSSQDMTNKSLFGSGDSMRFNKCEISADCENLEAEFIRARIYNRRAQVLAKRVELKTRLLELLRKRYAEQKTKNAEILKEASERNERMKMEVLEIRSNLEIEKDMLKVFFKEQLKRVKK